MMNWQTFAVRVSNGESPEVKSGDILDLLHSRDVALQALKDIVAECPRPTRPYGKRVVEIAKTAVRGAML